MCTGDDGGAETERTAVAGGGEGMVVKHRGARRGWVRMSELRSRYPVRRVDIMRRISEGSRRSPEVLWELSITPQPVGRAPDSSSPLLCPGTIPIFPAGGFTDFAGLS